MTLSNLTVGTATTGNNASVTPGTPSGLVAGDLAIIVAAIRNFPAGSPNVPAGWTRVASVGNFAIFGKFWETGDTIPAITFAGGVANADTYARALKVRGAALDSLTETSDGSSTNASAQNIAYPAFDTPGDNMLLLMALWKQDDATSIATPASWTSQGLTNMTAGDDMLVQLYTWLQTTDTNISSSSAVVTGGTSQISSAIIWAVRPAPTVSVTLFDIFPPRALVTVTGLIPGDDVEIYRERGGERALLRGGTLAGATDPSFVVVDGELPFGVSFNYVVIVNSVAEYSTSTINVPLPGGKPIFSDAISGASSSFVIVTWPEKTYQADNTVFKVGGRNVVVSGPMGMFTGQIEVFFEAWSSSEQLLALLNSATEGVLQLRRPTSAYEGVDCYLSITQAREQRFSQDGTDERRTWVLDVAEVDSWSSGQVSSSFTLQDLADYYSGLTLADLAGDFASLLALAQADLST